MITLKARYGSTIEAWGVNDQTGVNVLRGVRRPDDTDEAVS